LQFITDLKRKLRRSRSKEEEEEEEEEDEKEEYEGMALPINYLAFFCRNDLDFTFLPAAT
jgi:hypothetical protein